MQALSKAFVSCGGCIGGRYPWICMKNPDSFQTCSLTRLTQERDSKEEPYFLSSILSWAMWVLWSGQHVHEEGKLKETTPNGTQPANLLWIRQEHTSYFLPLPLFNERFQVRISSCSEKSKPDISQDFDAQFCYLLFGSVDGGGWPPGFSSWRTFYPLKLSDSNGLCRSNFHRKTCHKLCVGSKWAMAKKKLMGQLADECSPNGGRVLLHIKYFFWAEEWWWCSHILLLYVEVEHFIAKQVWWNTFINLQINDV